MFSLYHIPLVFDFVQTDPFYHALMTVVIFIAAFFMWWPLVHKVQSQPQITGILKLGYIMADGILMTPACALIMFSEAPIYATYSDAGAWIQALHLCVPSDMLAGLALTGPGSVPHLAAARGSAARCDFDENYSGDCVRLYSCCCLL
ncbi:hypothetical protein BSAF29S_03488 [Bacillus safensis subsp. safensis]